MNIVLASKKFVPTTKQAMEIGSSLGHDLLLNKGKYHHINTRTQVKGLATCTSLTAWAEKVKYEAHSAPELEPLEAVENRINEILDGIRDRLNDTFSEIHAFITGGIEYNPKNPVSEKSMSLIEEMYDILSEKGVQTSVIAGQRGDGVNTRINTLSFKDNIFMYGKPIDDVLDAKIDLKDALNKHFDFVELSDDISVSALK